MSELMIFTSKQAAVVDPFESYWQSPPPAPALDISLPYHARVQRYKLIEGGLFVLSVTLRVPATLSKAAIMQARNRVLKAALGWQKQQVSQQEADSEQRYVLSLDIQEDEDDTSEPAHLLHHFGTRYFVEELVMDGEQQIPLLQVFAWQDWQAILTRLPSPADIWQFLNYHDQRLRASMLGDGAEFDTEMDVLEAFLCSPQLLAEALLIDKALVAAGIADMPNAALQRLQQQLAKPEVQDTLEQAASLWGTLCKQNTEPMIDDEADEASLVQAQLSQQVLLDESLFSRHELVRTLYKHAEQIPELQQTGYVIHQHSYTRLGRHYMLIFYGNDAQARHSRQAIVPKLAAIAEDVAVRLPLDTLSQVVIMGVDFITEGQDTFVDLDVWIQPVAALSQNERRMAQKIKQLNAQVQQASQSASALTDDDLPTIQMHYSVPPRV